jgi:N-acetylglutamate synthase-like GNAT family acetyltransferase
LSEPAILEYLRDGYTISTDKSRLDITAIHSYLSGEAYWSKGIPREVVERGIENSLCFGVYQRQRQVGFARVISDYASFAYLCDVFILEPYRAQGLGKWLMSCIMSHPDLQGLRNFLLFTKDAHGLYAQYGFTPVSNPERIMAVRDLDIYQRQASQR